MQVLVEVLQERSRSKKMDEPGRFTMDSHEAVKVGDLEEDSVVLPKVESKFKVDYPEAVLEGVWGSLRKARSPLQGCVPSRKFCDSEGRVVMGDLCRHPTNSKKTLVGVATDGNARYL